MVTPLPTPCRSSSSATISFTPTPMPRAMARCSCHAALWEKTLDFMRGSANINGSFSRSESHLLSQNMAVNSISTGWSAGGKINGMPLQWLSFDYSISFANSRMTMNGINSSWLSGMEKQSAHQHHAPPQVGVAHNGRTLPQRAYRRRIQKRTPFSTPSSYIRPANGLNSQQSSTISPTNANTTTPPIAQASSHRLSRSAGFVAVNSFLTPSHYANEL